MKTQGSLFNDWAKGSWSGAEFDPSQEYRYTLTRGWHNAGPEHKGRIMWVMLNPSTADATQDDPTIRRCIGFSKTWGYDSLMICNLFALRATNPKELVEHDEPIGVDNDHCIDRTAEHSNLVVAAWGAHRMAKDRGDRVYHLLHRHHEVIYCLGRTKEGFPRHPLYVRRSQDLVAL